MEGGLARFKSTRKSVRRSLGGPWKKLKVDDKTDVEPHAESRGHLGQYFNDYESVVSEKEAESRIAVVREQLHQQRCSSFKDSDIVYALKSLYAKEDPFKASELLMFIETAEDGVLHPYSPNTKLAGAVNRNKTTCYLDATLFAMFVRPADFEAILYHKFETDPARKRLATLLRVWVNVLRSGNLINVDITKQIQDSLAECGWQDAARNDQQDASEAFGFITDKLDLPRLTLKKDMFHQGLADQDDHKFTNERTIDVAIPAPHEDGSAVTLEECLQDYFDERVLVDRRGGDLARRSTIGSSPARMNRMDSSGEKARKALHIEVAELAGSNPSTPIATALPSYLESRPQLTERGRVPSIFSEMKTDDDNKALFLTRENSLPTHAGRKRTRTFQKTVRMPAFQFFRLIPWYTEGNPNRDIQVAQHFESKRPTVGICLKRFGQDKDGNFTKRTDFIDVPIESGIPSFLHDDDFTDERFPNWKFKLSLQSAVCHRGQGLYSGHYVSLVRVDPPHGPPPLEGAQHLEPGQDAWLLFDDLASPRVRYVNIHEALKHECPYMLFYKIVRVDGDRNPVRVSMDGRPPSYTSVEAQSTGTSTTSANDMDPLQQTRVPPISPPIGKEGSTISAVLSNKPGTVLPGHGSPVLLEPRHESIAGVEASAIEPLETSALAQRSISVPESAAAAATATAEPVNAPEQISASRSAVPAHSRPSSSGNNNNNRSLHRLSMMFKGRSLSKERTVPDHLNPPATLSQTSIQGPRPVTPRQCADKDWELVDSENTDGKTTQLAAAPDNRRKSLEELRSRKKEKPSHKRERSLAHNFRSDRPDRECILM